MAIPTSKQEAYDVLARFVLDIEARVAATEAEEKKKKGRKRG